RFLGTRSENFFFRPGGFDFVLRLNDWRGAHFSLYAKTVSIISPILYLFSVRVGSEPRGWNHARWISVSRSRKRAEQYKPEQRHFLPDESMSDPIGLRVYRVTLDFGGGADVKFLRWIGLRGEI